MNSSAVIELHFLPCIQFFSKLLIYEKVLIEQWENYSKGSYRNRCLIAGVNGVQRLSIPLKKGKNQQQNIQQVAISYNEPWQNEHWTSIQSAYGNAPFFEYYAEEIKTAFLTKETFLFDYNLLLLNTFIRLTGIETNIELTSVYNHKVTTQDDLRNSILPKPNYFSKDQTFKQKKYSQVFEEKNGFSANLSILDLLFCTGPESSYIIEQSFVDYFLE